MKNPDIQPTQIERRMRDDDFIVSKTDTRGRIVYGNRTFIEFSGYSEAELLGAQHNIIRHPDMPRSAFALVWSEIQAGRECFAYVKNMARDGSFYWVKATLTPDRDSSGQIRGYFSVRRKPRPEAIQTISTIYAEMRQAERQAGAVNAMNAGTRVLQERLNRMGMSYEEFVVSL